MKGCLEGPSLQTYSNAPSSHLQSLTVGSYDDAFQIVDLPPGLFDALLGSNDRKEGGKIMELEVEPLVDHCLCTVVDYRLIALPKGNRQREIREKIS